MVSFVGVCSGGGGSGDGGEYDGGEGDGGEGDGGEGGGEGDGGGEETRRQRHNTAPSVANISCCVFLPCIHVQAHKKRASL